jgi:hypothetical protein
VDFPVSIHLLAGGLESLPHVFSQRYPAGRELPQVSRAV